MRNTVVNRKNNEPGEREAGYMHTIQQLRQRNFSKNLPFLIVSGSLPEGQVYREFPDGRIELQQMAVTDTPSFHFQLIRKLAPLEADKVREEYGLH